MFAAGIRRLSARSSAPCKVATLRPSAHQVLRRKLNTQSFWQWTTQDRPLWTKDKKEGLIAVVIFGITGSASAFFVRPAVETVFGIQGSLIEGPNSYRVISLLCLSPIYGLLLGTLGTLAGRHKFFAAMSLKVVGRFMPKKLVHRMMCSPARNKVTAANNNNQTKL